MKGVLEKDLRWISTPNWYRIFFLHAFVTYSRHSIQQHKTSNYNTLFLDFLNISLESNNPLFFQIFNHFCFKIRMKVKMKWSLEIKKTTNNHEWSVYNFYWNPHLYEIKILKHLFYGKLLDKISKKSENINNSRRLIRWRNEIE